MSEIQNDARAPRGHCGLTVVELLVAMAVIAVLAVIALPSYQGYIDRAKQKQMEGDMREIEVALQRYGDDHGGTYPDNLAQVGMDALRDAWNRPFQYLNLATAPPGQARKDHNQVPLNTDFDLYSLGKDGASQPPLTANASRDDFVRANNGRFMGWASDY